VIAEKTAKKSLMGYFLCCTLYDTFINSHNCPHAPNVVVRGDIGLCPSVSGQLLPLSRPQFFLDFFPNLSHSLWLGDGGVGTWAIHLIIYAQLLT